MIPCVLCRGATPGASDGANIAICSRCASALTAKGHPLSPDRLAPEAMTAEILTLLGERGARLVDGVAYERELTADEIATLLGNDVSGDTKIGS